MHLAISQFLLAIDRCLSIGGRGYDDKTFFSSYEGEKCILKKLVVSWKLTKKYKRSVPTRTES